MKWITTDGDPYILIPKDKLNNWSGTERSLSGGNKDIVRLDFVNVGLSDFEQACMLEGDLGILQFEDVIAVVLPGENDITIVNDKYIARLYYCENISDVSSKLEQGELEKIETWNYDITIELGSEKYVIFGSAIVGTEVKDNERFDMNLRRGFYQISVKHYRPDERTYLILYRFKRMLVPF